MTSDRRRFCEQAGARLRQFRTEAGFATAAEFARALDLPAATIQRMERRFPTRSGPFMLLCQRCSERGFYFSLDWLLGCDNRNARRPRLRVVQGGRS